MFKASNLGNGKKNVKDNLVLKVIMIISIFAIFCVTVSFIKDIFAYWTNYTNEIANNFTVSGERRITYNYHLLDDDSILQDPQTESAEIGSTVSLNSSKILNNESYTFVNFKIGETEYNLNDEFVMPNTDVTVDEYYVQKYSITYVLNGGTNNNDNPSIYTMLDTITLNAPTKDRYAFAGWYETEEFEGEPTTIINGRTGDITLYAKWQKSEFKVTAHHYEEGTTDKIGNDVVLTSNTLGAPYEITKLADTARYYYVSVEGNNIGTFTEEDIEVTFYYRVRTFEITSDAGVGGRIEGADETVRYGENSVNDIDVVPDVGNKIRKIEINGVRQIGYREDKQTKEIRLNKFTNVTEDKVVSATFMPIPMVAKIIAVPEGYDESLPAEERLLNTEYEYLEYAIDKIPLNMEGFVIQIIHDIDNEVNIIENKIITIDLNGYIVNAQDSTYDTLHIKSGGDLTIIDSKTNGKVSNELGRAIKVEVGGSLTLGKDDGRVTSIGPIIEAKTKGILNSGVFNFYDGKVRGTITIEGEVTKTPRLYEVATATTGLVSEATLAKVAQCEAMIGKTKYSLLEEAIEAANNTQGLPGQQVRIDVATNISKNQKILVDNTKNIKLDLNGYTITSEVQNYLFENQGTLEIIDSNTEIVPEEGEEIQIGKIYSATSDTILNSENGKLTITSGTIQNNNSSKYVIISKDNSELIINNNSILTGYNGIKTENNAKLIINNGNVTSSSGYGIYAQSAVQAVINGGNVKSNAGSVIYNNGTGEILINGGTIEQVSSDSNTGIYNYNTGKITIKNGIFNLNSGTRISNYKGEINIEGGTFNVGGNSYATFINNSINSKLNVSGGTFNITVYGTKLVSNNR